MYWRGLPFTEFVCVCVRLSAGVRSPARFPESSIAVSWNPYRPQFDCASVTVNVISWPGAYVVGWPVRVRVPPDGPPRWHALQVASPGAPVRDGLGPALKALTGAPFNP